MELAGLKRIKHTWSDWVFRRMRRGAGLELSICVLVTAELIATIYYAALREATASGLLRSLCDQILEDEAYHIRLRQDHRGWRITISEHLQRILMRGTCLVVWKGHGRVLQASGLDYWSFQAASLRQLESILRPRKLASLASAAA